MEKVSYPRFSDEQRLVRNLKNEEIEDIKRRRSRGETIESIALLFGVCISTIRYHLEPAFREGILERAKKYERMHKVQASKAKLRLRNRKIELIPNELYKYERSKNKKHHLTFKQKLQDRRSQIRKECV